MRLIFLLETGARPGAFNMRLDALLAESFESLAFPPESVALRLYQWSPPAISIGYHQRESDFDMAKLRADGIELCRRPTGGRAVFHIDDLTYAVATLATKSTAEHYAEINRAFKLALERLGIETDYQKRQPDFRARYQKPESVSCFATSARYELEVRGKKIIGSAQRRFGNALLQHGSLALSPKHKALPRYLALDEAARTLAQRELDEKTTSLAEVLGFAPTYDELKRAIVSGFEQVFNATTTRLELSSLPFHDALAAHS
ncbi:MAG: lipoate--protein ligase family protein [Chloroherpetonaceae bacterium]|nr:lipoate--protein ligase family protein [Chloroherpetonaceae bacterium]MDW8436951.1 lipoate--protein ligase family protein [Chloroherpetonaceae bacterium]